MSVPFRDVSGGTPVPDVAALVRQVQAGVADKLARGIYTPADLEEVHRIEREIRKRTDAGPAPADDMVRLHTSWDPLGPYTFTSHRGGVGALIVTAKQWLRRLATPLVAATLARQAEFNSAVVRLLTGSMHDVQSIDAGNDALLRKLDEMERRNLELRARIDHLQRQVRGLQDRLEPDGPAERP